MIRSQWRFAIFLLVPAASPVPAAVVEPVRHSAADAAVARVADLNGGVQANLDSIKARNAAAQADFAARQKAYVAAVEAQRVASADATQRHQRELAEWRNRVKACKSGDRSQCKQ